MRWLLLGNRLACAWTTSANLTTVSQARHVFLRASNGAYTTVEGAHSMTDLARLGLALVGFAVAVVAAGIVLGFIAARMAKQRGRD